MSVITHIIKDFTAKNGHAQSGLLPLLHEIVTAGCPIDEEVAMQVADAFHMPPAEVFGVVSFYPYLQTEAFGKYTIRLCRNISCMMKGHAEIISAITKQLKIKVGETTDDKKFTLLQANCLGWCHQAPAMTINQDVFTNLTPAKAIEIINEYLKK